MTTILTTDTTSLVKTFGKPSATAPDSSLVSKINLPIRQANGSKLDIIIGMLDTEGFLASREVKETLALLVLEASKALKMDIEDLIRFSTTSPGKISMTTLGIGMVNQLRPNTSQMGFGVIPTTFAKTELVNRNIFA
jgi:hypothetical protein